MSDPARAVRRLLREMQDDPAELRRVASYIGNLIRAGSKGAAADPSQEALRRRIENLLDEARPWR